MAVGSERKCIYCKKEGSSREHVAPSSLGGNCTLNCVCVKCNRDLSEVDQALAEHSPVGLSKILLKPPSAFPTQLGSYASMQGERGRKIAVRIGNQVSTEVRPQLFAEDNHIEVVASDRAGLNELIQFIDKQIEHGRLARTRVFIAEDIKDPRFLARLEEQWLEVKTKIETTPEQRQTHEQPNVLINLRRSC